MNEHELHDPKQPPQLKSLDFASLGVTAAAEDLVCDIDDPDCEAPASLTDERRTEVAPAAPPER